MAIISSASTEEREQRRKKVTRDEIVSFIRGKMDKLHHHLKTVLDLKLNGVTHEEEFLPMEPAGWEAIVHLFKLMQQFK